MANTIHNWTEIHGTEKRERRGVCFLKYLQSDAAAEKIIFYIPQASLDLVPLNNREFYLQFLSSILNKDVYSFQVSAAGAKLELDCVALNKNKFLVFIYLVFFRYFLEMPGAINVFAKNNSDKDLTREELLLNYLKQHTIWNRNESGVLFDTHSITGGFGNSFCPVADIIKDLNDTAVLKSKGHRYFLRID